MKPEKMHQRTHDAAQISTLSWAIRNIALPEGPWDFAERLWQIDIFEDWWPQIVVKKAAQIGLTTIFLMKMLHFLDIRPHRRGMYTLPRQDDLYTFVPARLVPMINGSPHLLEHVGTDKDDPQGVRLRRFGNSYLYFSEASVEPREVPVDILANDEVDRSHEDYLDMFQARLDASQYAFHYRFSTPTIPGFGVDKLWERTDQREWFVACPHCNREQKLSWEETLWFDKDSAPYYACVKCKRELDPACIINGRWVATGSGIIHGYHCSHMMLPLSKPPALLYEQSLDMKDKNFFNLKLGETHTPSMGGMPRGLFKSCFQVPYSRETSPDNKSSYYIGIDQANDIHVLVGKRRGDALDVVFAKIIRFSNKDSWEQVAKIIRRFKPVCCVIDALPNRHNVKGLSQDIGRKKIYAAFYSSTIDARETRQIRSAKESHELTVHIHHTDSFDELRDATENGEIGLWGRWSSHDHIVDDIITHCGHLKRDEEERTTQVGKVTVGVWRKTGAEHWANALNYLRTAFLIKRRSTLKVVEIDVEKERRRARGIIVDEKTTAKDQEKEEPMPRPA